MVVGTRSRTRGPEAKGSAVNRSDHQQGKEGEEEESTWKRDQGGLKPGVRIKQERILDKLEEEKEKKETNRQIEERQTKVQ